MSFSKIKPLLFALVLAISLPSWAGLKELAEAKSQNYQTLLKYYGSLHANAKAKDAKTFCAKVAASKPVLEQIFEDDNLLIDALREVNDQDYYDYATHLEENSFSPLFSYGAHSNLCQTGNFGNFEETIQSSHYHVVNINFLILNHQIWRESYGL